MRQVPRRLIRHSQMPFELTRRNALFGFAHQSNSSKPLLQRQVGIVEQSARRWREVKTTLPTLEYQGGLLRFANGLDAVYRIVIARDTAHARRPPGFDPILHGRLLGREHLGKRKEVHIFILTEIPPYVKGIIVLID